MLPATPSASWVHYTSCNTQSSAPEDGQNNSPKHVELTGIINKPLLLHLVYCLYYLYQWCTVKKISDNEIYLLIKYIKSVLWRVAKCLSYIEDARCLKVKQRADYFILVNFVSLWRCGLMRSMASSVLRFLDHTQQLTTVGRNPLDVWSVPRRDLYLTTHNTLNRHTSMTPAGFEPAILASERPQTYTLDREASETGTKLILCY